MDPRKQHLLQAQAGEIYVHSSTLSTRLFGPIFYRSSQVVKGSSKDDVNQGRLGNCWFLCALVGAATVKHIFKKLVPTDQVRSTPHLLGG